MFIVLYLLSAVLIVLKLLGMIAISWWLVFAPGAVAFTLATLFIVLVIIGAMAK